MGVTKWTKNERGFGARPATLGRHRFWRCRLRSIGQDRLGPLSDPCAAAAHHVRSFGRQAEVESLPDRCGGNLCVFRVCGIQGGFEAGLDGKGTSEKTRKSRSNACRAGLSLLKRHIKRRARGSTFYCTWRGKRFIHNEGTEEGRFSRLLLWKEGAYGELR